MVGGARTGALSMAFGATLRAPHGGVFVVPLIGNPFRYLLASAAGMCVTAGLVVVLKGMRGAPREAVAGDVAVDSGAAAREAQQPVAA
jgi:PTS system fructose-specific IIC component